MSIGKKSISDLARIEGKQEYEITGGHLQAFNEWGMLAVNITDTLGEAVAKKLGISSNSDIDEREYRKLITDLGQNVLYMAVNKGLVEVHDVSGAEYDLHINYIKHSKRSDTVKFVRMTPKGESLIEDNKNVFESISKQLGIESDMRREPSSVPYEDNKSYTPRNNDITTVPKKAVKALNTLRKMKHVKLDTSVKFIKENKDLVLKLMGYKDTDTMKTDMFDEVESQKARNKQIVESVDELLNSDMNEMYFDWFYTKNGRYMMDSNTINPQTDTLHRFVVVPESHMVELDRNNKDDMGKLKYALAQAVGFAVDKKSTEDIQANGEQILRDGSNKLLEDMKGTEFEVDHIGHYLQAVEAVKAYENSTSKFTVSITAEFDALTSGFGIKSMQFPVLENMNSWLEKVGVFTDRSIKSMNDVLSEDGFYDSYQTLAKDIRKGKIVPESDEFGIWSELSKVLPEAVNGKVYKELRDLFKLPFMTFNYSAGYKSGGR